MGLALGYFTNLLLLRSDMALESFFLNFEFSHDNHRNDHRIGDCC